MTQLTSRLLKEAHEAAARHAGLSRRITEAFEHRYGVTHSDVDCDWLIDSLDYGIGALPTLKLCDEMMAEKGFALPVKEGKTP